MYIPGTYIINKGGKKIYGNGFHVQVSRKVPYHCIRLYIKTIVLAFIWYSFNLSFGTPLNSSATKLPLGFIFGYNKVKCWWIRNIEEQASEKLQYWQLMSRFWLAVHTYSLLPCLGGKVFVSSAPKSVTMLNLRKTK